jgi:hypothetical protein
MFLDLASRNVADRYGHFGATCLYFYLGDEERRFLRNVQSYDVTFSRHRPEQSLGDPVG